MPKFKRSISANRECERHTEMGESNVLLRDIHPRDTQKFLA
nr:MAG TPA: hypothetical protein [Caudoviricetes sp.]